MLLVELFTTVYPIGVDMDTATYYRLKFWDPKVLVPVMFEARFLDEDDNSWEIVFSRGREVTVTGQGNAYKIFATVVECIKQFIHAKEPGVIIFTADGLSRQRLYRTMVEKLANSLGYKEDSQTFPGSFALIKHETD